MFVEAGEAQSERLIEMMGFSTSYLEKGLKNADRSHDDY
jgi:hypothetical protein